jgi:tetratricopeptide (TPR) repeat protein
MKPYLMKHYLRTLAVTIAVVLSACADTDEPSVEAATRGHAAVPLYTNLGSYHRSITTDVPETQQYFDQGIRLTYGFNHDEAIRAFEEAARLDPECAMCYWGIAYALGPNINAPMDPSVVGRAYEAVQRASELASGASGVERALIEALAQRYTATPPQDRALLDQAYALAMSEVAQRFPDDHDVVTLYAEARMDLRPWQYWTMDGEPEEGTTEMVADLQRVLEADPNHPGACHYYIHAVEAVSPEKAVACADRLAALMPGAGHLVHMPAHVYIRVGRWADAITANEHAVHTDETYIADQRPTGMYPVGYYPHNNHFLSFAATMIGRSEQAIRTARAVVQSLPAEVVRQAPTVEPLLAYGHLTLVTFGRWDDVLNEPQPPADLAFATALVQYARGVAYAAKQDRASADAALEVVEGAANGVTDPVAGAVLRIAAESLAGEIAARNGALADAERHFRSAMEIEDGLIYMEPPFWYYPVRHSLGKVLLEEGKATEAEALYRQDLTRFPENGWSLFGLAESLRRQGRGEDAASVQRRFDDVWQGADVQLTASRF